MITADTLEVLTTYSPQYLTKAAQNAGAQTSRLASSWALLTAVSFATWQSSK